MDLIKATIANNEARVRELLASGENVNQLDRRNMTPLLYAACGSGNRADLIPILLEAGADVNCVGDAGKTPLFWVTLRGDVESLDLLLRHGANARHKDFRGSGVLSGVQAQDLPSRFLFLQRLIDAGADPNNRNVHGHLDLPAPLIHAESDDLHCQRIFNLLFQHGFDFRCVEDGQNMLHAAVSYASGSLSAARLLIEEAGLAVDAKTSDELGTTALHLATRHHYPAIIAFLIQNGANLETRDSTGQTPFFMAKDLEFWKRIGADINAYDNHGRTTLMRCCALGQAPQPIELSAMSPELATQHRHSAMRYQRQVQAAESRIKELLQLGADTSMRDNQGFSALDIAIQTQQPALISLLSNSTLLRNCQ